MTWRGINQSPVRFNNKKLAAQIISTYPTTYHYAKKLDAPILD